MWIAVPIVGNRATFCRASKKDSNDIFLIILILKKISSQEANF